MVPSKPRVDVAIIGAGPAGLAAAIHACQLGLTTALLHKAHTSDKKVGETIQGNCRYPLERLGLWQKFLTDQHLASGGSASCWGSDQVGYNDFMYQVQGQGWHLDRPRFESMLYEGAQNAGTAIYADTSLEQSDHDGQSWLLKARDAQGASLSLRASFVLDCSGRSAIFSRARKAQAVFHDKLVGVFAFFDARERIDDRASYSLVETCSNGWWYSALLPEQMMVVGFMSDSDLVRGLDMNTSAAWIQQVQLAPNTRQHLTGTHLTNGPRTIPAASQRYHRNETEPWVAAGDAASTFDPLSSQGIYKALDSGISASETAAAWLRGDTAAVARYCKHTQDQYETYLQMRTHFYQMERRWQDAPFWQRRHQQIHLNPKQILRTTTKNCGRRGMFLPPSELQELNDCFRQPSAAFAGLQRFKQRRKQNLSDTRLIQALQYLHEKQILMPA